jgi:hypothetical protein
LFFSGRSLVFLREKPRFSQREALFFLERSLVFFGEKPYVLKKILFPMRVVVAWRGECAA